MSIRAGTCLLALTAVLASCSSEEPPASLPPLPSLSPSPSASGALGGKPVSNTPAGAAEFVRVYMDTLESALATANDDQLVALSNPKCDGCNNFIGAVRQLQVREQRVQGAPIEILSLEAAPFDRGPVVVDLRYSRGPGRLTKLNGDLVTDIVAEPPLDALVRLERSGPSWMLAGFSASGSS